MAVRALGEPPAKLARYSAVYNEDMRKTLEGCTPKTTKTTTSFWEGLFHNFCKEQNIGIDLTTRSPSDLDDSLVCFYLGPSNAKS